MLEIQAWQQYYEASFQHFNIIAITPEIAEYALATSQDNAMRFPLLIDQHLQLANELGLVHTLDADMKDVLLKWDIDIHKRTCDERYSLPIPATFVIDQDRTVKYVYIEEDYTQRAEPEEVLKIYQKLDKK